MTNNTHLTELGHSPDALAQRQAELAQLSPPVAGEACAHMSVRWFSSGPLDVAQAAGTYRLP